MGLLTRHSGAPYLDGETLPAADLETDIARAYEEIAGNIEDINLRFDADIPGSGGYLADGTIRGSLLADNTLPAAKIASGSVIESKVLPETILTPKIATGILAAQIDSDTSTQTLGAVFTTIASVSLTTSAAAQAVLLLAFGITSNISLGLLLELAHGTTEILSWKHTHNIPQDRVPFSISALFVPAVSTAYTFNLRARIVGGGGGDVSDAILVAVNIGR